MLPKLIVYRLLEPAFRLGTPVQIVCREGKAEFLFAELAVHALDLVLNDAPMGTQFKVRAFSHLLGECPVSIFGTPESARSFRPGFPNSLNGAPFLLPTNNTSLRHNLEQWFDSEDIRPEVRGEFEDHALLKAFGQAGIGLFPGPSAIEKEIAKQYGVRVIGRIDSIHERFYAISVERKIKHPAVVAIAETARGQLFR